MSWDCEGTLYVCICVCGLKDGRWIEICIKCWTLLNLDSDRIMRIVSIASSMLPKLGESAREYGTRPRLTVVASEVHFFTQFPEKDSEDVFGALSRRDTARMGERYVFLFFAFYFIFLSRFPFPVSPFLFLSSYPQSTHSSTSIPFLFPSILPPTPESLSNPHNYRYETSKLLQVFYLRALAAHTSNPTSNPNNAIILNIVNPGLCHSDFNREGRLDLAVMKFFLARTTEVGSRNLVYATTAGEETHGLYISSCRVDS